MVKNANNCGHIFFPVALRTLRRKARRTQSQLAEDLCCSNKLISHWESGRLLPVNVGVVLDIAETLGYCGSGRRWLGLAFLCDVCGSDLELFSELFGYELAQGLISFGTGTLT
jgi:transcriptional regulator with XRE-family HTH domain